MESETPDGCGPMRRCHDGGPPKKHTYTKHHENLRTYEYLED